MKRYLEFIKENSEEFEIKLSRLLKSWESEKVERLLNDDLVIITLKNNEELDADMQFDLYQRYFERLGYLMYHNDLEYKTYFIILIKEDSKLFKWIKKNLFNLKGEIDCVDLNYINSKDEWKFYHKNVSKEELENENLCINQDRVWSFFVSKFSLEYQQIQCLLKGILEEHYKIKV